MGFCNGKVFVWTNLLEGQGEYMCYFEHWHYLQWRTARVAVQRPRGCRGRAAAAACLAARVSICFTLYTGITHNGAQLGWQCSVREAAEVELQLPLVWLPG